MIIIMINEVVSTTFFSIEANSWDFSSFPSQGRDGDDSYPKS